MIEATVSVVDSKALLALLGTRDQHIRQIRQNLKVEIAPRDNHVHVIGEAEAVRKATDLLEELKRIVDRHGSVSPEEVARLVHHASGNGRLSDDPTIEVFESARQIRPQTPGQRKYVRAIEKHDLTFCVGPAGSGKTYLAVAMAVAALRKQSIRKIVLVRPAVEAGESLGYLPGDLAAKINPYLRPLLDALREMMDFEQMKRFTEQEVIEVIPLAYMRGRTLNSAFIILDEAQNTTVSQMKMFLTRMGQGSKIVISGDTTQVDLSPHSKSGLIDAIQRLRGIKGIRMVRLREIDIVRHRLVQEIVKRYDDGPQGPRSREPHV